MQTPFFTVITRTFKGREKLLERCQESVSAQSFKNISGDPQRATIEHLILRDEVGVGVAEAQKMMWQSSPRGEYVLVLDDDDYLTAPDVLEKLHVALSTARPAFAVVRVTHGELGEMPYEWGDGQVPPCGHITVSNVVVEHVEWYFHRESFTPEYAGDYSFIKSLFDAHKPTWVDLNLVTVEQRRMGATA